MKVIIEGWGGGDRQVLRDILVIAGVSRPDALIDLVVAGQSVVFSTDLPGVVDRLVLAGAEARPFPDD